MCFPKWATKLLAALRSKVTVHCTVCGEPHILTNRELPGVTNPSNELWICPECQ